MASRFLCVIDRKTPDDVDQKFFVLRGKFLQQSEKKLILGGFYIGWEVSGEQLIKVQVQGIGDVNEGLEADGHQVVFQLCHGIGGDVDFFGQFSLC